MKPKKQWWSVMLLYPDYVSFEGPETWYGWVKASTRDKAVSVARRVVIAENDYDWREELDVSPEDFEELLVLKGKHEGV